MTAMKPGILFLSLLAACAGAPAFAGTHVLLPAQADDMVPSTLMARAAATGASPAARAADTPQIHVEHQPISINWPIPRDNAVQSAPEPFTRDSREYWTDVSATELQQGVKLPLTAPGAIIRLSPGDAAVGTLQSREVKLQLGRQSLTLDHAAHQLADAQAMHAAGMDVPAASMVLKLRPELGSGMATLQASAASGRYVVHVFEPQSTLALRAQADRNDLLLGDHVHLRVELQDAGRHVSLSAVGGYLRAPDGSTTNLDYQRQADGSYTVDAQPRGIPSTPGLWEVHSFTMGTDANGQEVRRDTTTVFAAALPDARLSGIAETARTRHHGIDIKLGVTARSASRFAVSAVLYGRAEDGSMAPAAFAQTAAWLRPGDGTLTLHFDRASLQGIGAPYELHDLRLQDQPAVSLVERHALALRFDNP